VALSRPKATGYVTVAIGETHEQEEILGLLRSWVSALLTNKGASHGWRGVSDRMSEKRRQ